MREGAEVARVPEPVLSTEDAAAFARGVAQFNGALFFECHDTLEEVWSGVRGEPRDFFQGLIQAAVGFHHLTSGNRGGAARLFERALRRLERYPPRYAGLEVERLRATVRDWKNALTSGDDLPGGRPPPRIERA